MNENALPVVQAMSNHPEPQQSMALSIEEVVGQINLIQQVMGKVMTDGEHYGTIPGCGPKPTLLKPGAEKLSLTFRLAPGYTIDETDLGKGHRQFKVICALRHIPTGDYFGEGVGICSTMESKYRFRRAGHECPKCGQEDTIIEGKQEYGGGWLCFKKKGGCGAKFKDGDPVIENQKTGRTEHDNPADNYNTCIKMAKKRAHVDAVLTATAASDIFTQDIEETGSGEDPPSSGGEGEVEALVEKGKPLGPSSSFLRSWNAHVRPLLKEAEILDSDFKLWIQQEDGVASSKELSADRLKEIETLLRDNPGSIVEAIGSLKELLDDSVRNQDEATYPDRSTKQGERDGGNFS